MQRQRIIALMCALILMVGMGYFINTSAAQQRDQGVVAHTPAIPKVDTHVQTATAHTVTNAVVPEPVVPVQSIAPQVHKNTSGTYVLLSRYYALPGEQVEVIGHRFVPGEQVTVSLLNGIHTLAANADGSFVSQAFTIPFSAQDSTKHASVHGAVSGDYQVSLKVGTFYPVVEPSLYFAHPNDAVTFHGWGFAPGEPVAILHQGGPWTVVVADAGGGFTSQAWSPAAADIGSHSFTFTGEWSGKSYGVSINIDRRY